MIIYPNHGSCIVKFDDQRFSILLVLVIHDIFLSALFVNAIQ